MKSADEFIPFSLPSIGIEEENAVLRVMRSGWLTTGKEALAFEREFAEKIGVTQTLAVNSATSGLLLAYAACGVDAQSAILTTPYTFVSTANAARHLGGEVIYADIEKDSYSLDPDCVEKKLAEDARGKKLIKAIVPVHIAGNVCNMKALCDIAARYGVKVVEDSAHAFPSKTADGYAGTLGDIGVYSFYATKTITTAEGGMIALKDEQAAKSIECLRLHGIDRAVWDRYTAKTASWMYDVTACGWKCNLPDILAAIGREQLKKADLFLEKRKKIVTYYNKAFAEYDFLQLPPDGDGNAWHLYLLRLRQDKLRINRNEFANLLQQKGIGISVHFIPHFRLSFWKNLYNLQEVDFPNATRQFEATVTLPLWPDMTDEMVERVVDMVIKTGKEHYAG